MKAAIINNWDGIDAIKLETLPHPIPKDNEVLVAVYAAGVNPIDFKVSEGYLSGILEDCFPFPLGWDFSGTIKQVGKNVSNFQEGDEVFGLIRFPEPAGTFAEWVTAPADQISLKPKKCDHVQAAGVPLVSLTAWQGLFEQADLKPNQTILIHAASGSVGQYAVQFAKYKGAKVIAVGSKDSEALLNSYGIDQFIDYKAENFENKVKEIDVVLDPLAGENSLRSLNVIKAGGKLISLLALSPEAETKAKQKNVFFVRMLVKPNAKHLQDIAQLLDQGVIKPLAIKSFPLEQVKEALQLVKTGHSQGKVVLVCRA